MLPLNVVPKRVSEIKVKEYKSIGVIKMKKCHKNELVKLICELTGINYKSEIKDKLIANVNEIINEVEKEYPQKTSEQMYEIARRKCFAIIY